MSINTRGFAALFTTKLIVHFFRELHAVTQIIIQKMSTVGAVCVLNNLRPLGNYRESLWTNRFKPTTLDKQEYDKRAKEIEKLKEEVRTMLINIEGKERTRIETLNLIDTIERLGISYHFEKEIDQLLEEIFQENPNFGNNLCATALLFRLLRQHGFNISSGIFDQFLNGNGKFKESLSSDAEGLLSLYEAIYVRTRRDSVLEESLSFTTTHLKNGVPKMPTFLAKQVNHALEQSLHRGIPRIETRYYMSEYEKDERKNPLLLRFAKLDFCLLQMLHRQELDEILRWSNDTQIMSKHPYSRDRVVECYFWGLATFFESQHSLSRIIFAKTTTLASIIDDTYDSYGTIDELKAFRDAVERWDIEEIGRLPEYMRSLYKALLDVYEWINEELTKIGKSYAFPSFVEECKQYVRTSYIQSCWFLKRELPSFPEYRENALITSGYYQLITTSFVAMERATKDVFGWLSTHPKIVEACAEMSRFINDVASYEAEKLRGATGLECYMKEYNVPEEEAMKKFEEIGDNAWKDMNEGFLKPQAAVPREILMPILNLARVIDVVYNHGEDAYTNPHVVLESHIVSVLVDPIIV